MANNDGRHIISQLFKRLDILSEQNEALIKALDANLDEIKVIRNYLRLLDEEFKTFFDD